MKSTIHALILIIALLFSCEPKTKLEQVLEMQKQNMLLWQFPLPRTHTGALIGNGVQGLMIWGGGNQLNITIGRAGFWDRRGGKDFLKNVTYEEVKKFLHSGNENGLRTAFGMDVKAEPGIPKRPHQMGGGRLEIEFPEGWELKKGILELNYGIFEIALHDPDGNGELIRIRQSIYHELAAINYSKKLEGLLKIRLVPTWNYVKDQLEAVGVAPPEEWVDVGEDRPNIQGFIQSLPQDEPLAIGYKVTEDHIILASSVSVNAKEKVINELRDIPKCQILQEDIDWWDAYWRDVPKINLPNPIIQEIVNYGLYKQAISSPEHGIACSLQGPFNEE